MIKRSRHQAGSAGNGPAAVKKFKKETALLNVLLLTNMYPKEGQLYRNAFIHQRILEYRKRGLSVVVFVLQQAPAAAHTYRFEGVDVIEGGAADFLKAVHDDQPKKVLVHFIDRHMIAALEQLPKEMPILVWIHLKEAIGWYRRLFNFSDFRFGKYILSNIRQRYVLRRFIVHSERNVRFIFVSRWIKDTMEKDVRVKVPSYQIIPNVVDTHLFRFEKKNPELRKKILLIKPFVNKKYAVDLAVDAIVLLSKKAFFKDLQFTICGDGPIFDQTVAPLRRFTNVFCIKKFLSHQEIRQLHHRHGVLLAPTRQDSQGVSMCEAMASGLVAVTSDNSAIPEFVADRKTGLLTHSAQDIADAIDDLYRHPDLFERLARQASDFITETCGPDWVIEQECAEIFGSFGGDAHAK